ncbi:uncharacterized protein LOC131240072 [Magnolia sinica]|uniref:uncharacterized protein LOC131240072 n=1 Tax=Magnolia sinica TaxID=86752 RepID=UPI002658C815|nr:uncharacterized protein LOC131240072 [Magnolia sinica]XP_058094077.1 uncharacterized protein LOC131240072 [Magnolia sinica]XP_058094079.1 uncharacterized protein LOC131240072 [Magnolia sinica]XP_058094080.1 uncharacterized protein LOC131240072 [Magnolia sinica]XP_058094081.1 uncharacterized protein LOC131240072 [Magnolia sinica]XP_058094082.1 uncharacterized protein LOC131240072 [Magnolia sinica]XP_058094083.1 uncharacterized protein LOC131240072 [Magnolia sinica]XP_058094084.1 uncharacte
MVSANKHHPLPPPPQNPKNPNFPTTGDSDGKDPPSLPTHISQSSSSKTPLTIDGSEEDTALRLSGSLTREEVLRRRSRRVKQLARYYKSQYWALMDEVRAQYRGYYWKYGKSPFKEEGDSAAAAAEGSGENNGDFRNGCGGSGDSMKKCAFGGCKSKAMALTNYCHSHILSDSKQKLYKACSYVIKSAQTGQVICGKPVLRAAVPSLCTVHFQKAQRHVSQALKKAGLSGSSSNKPAPKFHVIVAEYVHQIQNRRREARNAAIENDAIRDENGG